MSALSIGASQTTHPCPFPGQWSISVVGLLVSCITPHYQKGLDLIFAKGPNGSLVPVASQILAIPLRQRPTFCLMMNEQLPNPNLPEWFRYWFGALRTQGEKMAYRHSGAGNWQPDPRLNWITNKAYRFRHYGDLWWLQRKGALNLLTTSSKWTAEFLRARGFDPLACL